jgi:hypothetical protein
MKVYRFAVHPEEGNYIFLECLNDPKLYTQARSMDEALLMARDVVDAMYGIKGVLIELVIPPDVITKYERRQNVKTLGRKKLGSRRPVALHSGKRAAVA